jgi:hypothetical protein
MQARPLLEVLYHDARCLVLNKPANVAMQGGLSAGGLAWKQMLRGPQAASMLPENVVLNLSMLLQKPRPSANLQNPCGPYIDWTQERQAHWFWQRPQRVQRACRRSSRRTKSESTTLPLCRGAERDGQRKPVRLMVTSSYWSQDHDCVSLACLSVYPAILTESISFGSRLYGHHQSFSTSTSFRELESPEHCRQVLPSRVLSKDW